MRIYKQLGQQDLPNILLKYISTSVVCHSCKVNLLVVSLLVLDTLSQCLFKEE